MLEVLKVELHKPEIVINGNDHKKFRRLLREGFYVAIRREDGFLIMHKETEILVTVEEFGWSHTINMRKALYKAYKKKNALDLKDLFEADYERGLVKIVRNSNGRFAVVKR